MRAPAARNVCADHGVTQNITHPLTMRFGRAQLGKRVARRVAERKAREAAEAAASAERARAERKAAEAKAIEDAKFAAIQAECGLDAAGVRAAVSLSPLYRVPGLRSRRDAAPCPLA